MKVLPILFGLGFLCAGLALTASTPPAKAGNFASSAQGKKATKTRSKKTRRKLKKNRASKSGHRVNESGFK